MKNTLSNTLIHIPVFDCVVKLLGMVFLFEFFMAYYAGYFSPTGFSTHLQDVAANNNAPDFWNAMLVQFSEHSGLLAPVYAALLLLAGTLCLLLITRKTMAFLSMCYWLFCWISFSTYPGIWFFEYLFPAVFAGLAWLAIRERDTHRYNPLGSQFFGAMKPIVRFILIAAVMSLYYYFCLLSRNGHALNLEIAFNSTLLISALLLLSAWIDRWRRPNPPATHSRWSHFAMIAVGSMLVTQVYADIAVNWFTASGYAQIIESFEAGTNAPDWFKHFLHWSASQSQWMMVVQFIFESSFAICLTMLIFRWPAILLTTGLLVMLMFTELGVDARWPVHPNDPRTWMWELLFVVSVCTLLSLQAIGKLLATRSWKSLVLGDPIFPSIHWTFRIIIAVGLGFILWFIGDISHVFGEAYASTTLRGGITFAVLLIISGLLLDRWRTKKALK